MEPIGKVLIYTKTQRKSEVNVRENGMGCWLCKEMAEEEEKKAMLDLLLSAFGKWQMLKSWMVCICNYGHLDMCLTSLRLSIQK